MNDEWVSYSAMAIYLARPYFRQSVVSHHIFPLTWAQEDEIRLNYSPTPTPKDTEKHYKCEGCKHQTHDEMEEFLGGSDQKGFKKPDDCWSCYDWLRPRQVRKNYTKWTPE